MIEIAVIVIGALAFLGVVWAVYLLGWDRGANSMLDLVNALDKEGRRARPPRG